MFQFCLRKFLLFIGYSFYVERKVRNLMLIFVILIAKLSLIIVCGAEAPFDLYLKESAHPLPTLSHEQVTF